MPSHRRAVAAAAIAASLSCSGEQTSAFRTTSATGLRASAAPTLTPQESGTTQRFFAVSPVNARVAWASARGGTYALTTDGGRTWISRQVPGGETLEFRDVEGVTDKVAYLMSAGEGSANRIYKTEDGGKTWTLQAQAGPDPRNFWDCFAFWTPRRGILMDDSVDGRFPVRRTTDGTHWTDIGDRLPPAQPGEGAFAASGTCAATQGENRAWLATGAAAQARILATTDGGNTWRASVTPIRQGTATSGNASVDFRDARHGMVGGGDVVDSATPQNNVARSRDGGRTWELATPTPFPGAVYGLTYTRNHREDNDDEGDDDNDDGGHARRVVSTGPSGAAWTENEGRTWTLLPGVTNCWSVGFANERTGWLVCGGGLIWRLDF